MLWGVLECGVLWRWWWEGMGKWGAWVNSLGDYEPASAAEVADEVCAPGVRRRWGVGGDDCGVVGEQWVFGAAVVMEYCVALAAREGFLRTA